MPVTTRREGDLEGPGLGLGLDDAPAAPDVRAWPRGHRIASFEFVDCVSAGATSLVYRAWDHALARPVAIKAYFPKALAQRASDGEVRPIRAEAGELFRQGRSDCVAMWRTLAQCEHPALVRMLAVFEAHGTACAVMPWYEGSLLSAPSLDGRPPLDPAALRALLGDLLGALEVLHRSGRAHGGVGPAKVLLREGAPAVLLSPVSAAIAAAPDAVAEDLRALIALARYGITGILPSAAGPGVPESLATTVEQLAFDRLSPRYDAGLRALLGASAPAPLTVAEFRRHLGAADPALPRPGPVHGRDRDDPRPEAANTAIEAETTELIRRVLASIPDRVDPDPRRAARPLPEPPGFAAIEREPAHDLRPPPARLRRRKHGLPWGAALAVCGIAVLALGAGWLPESPWRIAGAPSPAPASVAAPAPRPIEEAVPFVAAPVEPVSPTPMPQGPIAEPPIAKAPAPPAAVDPPVRAAPPRAAPIPPRATALTSPRAACGSRSDFSLYRCMQQQCGLETWRQHAQCVRLRSTDKVD